MKIKRYLDFISEELITNLSKLDLETANRFKDIFHNDPLELKEYLQIVMPNQNFKYLAKGCVGLTFEWMKSLPLPEEFYDDAFTGQKNISGEGKIIKFTCDKGEAEGKNTQVIKLRSKRSSWNCYLL